MEAKKNNTNTYKTAQERYTLAITLRTDNSHAGYSIKVILNLAFYAINVCLGQPTAQHYWRVKNQTVLFVYDGRTAKGIIFTNFKISWQSLMQKG